jgi:creatinine amidohydrolase/Fe(II)-dependent formamide hydrolase-like protein
MATGFKNVVLMGDHGGGQPAAYKAAAEKMDAKYAPQGKHVYFCDEVYAKAQGDFDKWLVDHGYPSSSHAGIPDTSTMLYLGGDKGWVRKELIPTAEGDPVPPPGQRGRQNDPNAPPRKNNGISGDARRSTAALGKMAFDIKVDYAVKQIQGFLGSQTKTTAQ